MQTKLIEILADAKGWMTAAEIADKGGWRSPANVGVALQQMEKATGNVERRKSATKKQGNGMPATEWKLTEKAFEGDTKPVVRKTRTTEAQASDPALIETNLRQQIAHLNDELAGEKSNVKFIREKLTLAEQQRDQHFAESETAKKKVADLEDDVRRHSSMLQNASTTVTRFLITTQQLVSSDNKPASLADAAQQIANTIQRLRHRIEDLELTVDTAQQTIASMELEAEQKAREAGHHQSENVALKTLNEAMPGFGAVHQAIADGPFVVRTPSKPPRFAKKPGNAQAAAMSAARQHGFAEVFALVPVGKAIRGAEWRPK